MRRCKICDCKYDLSHLYITIFDPSEDICPVCEEVIVDTLLDFGEEDKDDTAGD